MLGYAKQTDKFAREDFTFSLQNYFQFNYYNVDTSYYLYLMLM